MELYLKYEYYLTVGVFLMCSIVAFSIEIINGSAVTV